jgi:hypothetical protein
MAPFNLEPITRRGLAGFYRLLGASLIARLITDWHAGIYRVHTGELFPWRHLPIVPLYPPALLVLEWLLLGVSGVALLLLVRVRVALYVGLLAAAMGLSQRYSNQGALALIVLLCCVLQPTIPDDLDVRGQYPHLDLVRYQLLIVYVFSALNKLRAGFTTGQALATLLALPLNVAQAMSYGVVAVELLVPLLLVTRKQRLAWVGVVLLHLSFSVLMPGLIPFGLLMAALATLWLPPLPRMAR